MANLILPPNWRGKERDATSEKAFHDRREFLRLAGFTGLGLAAAWYFPEARSQAGFLDGFWNSSAAAKKKSYPAIQGLSQNPAFQVRRPLTLEEVALKYNNFYEFTAVKENVWKRVDSFKPQPWTVEVAGHVKNPRVYDVEELLSAFPLEERIYRHRCVETWAMVVPWNGFPLRSLVTQVEPTSRAKYLRFTSFLDPEVAPGQGKTDLPWPYTEGLTLDEAMNELAFVATGIYGHRLPNQHGAPLRLVTPWKYGVKSIKSVTRIEFLDHQPATFWNTLIPREYDFPANVDPDAPHPRWSQRREKMIGTGEVFATRKFNGYGEWVAGLYA
ncbi:MAG: protein-methionine-sulfoxide reductase catalytic subunit MsrP [Nitrospinaceae bacterium]